MDRCLGIINIKDTGENFGGLCNGRPEYMLPFGGRYRLIDIPISSMVNHGIETVAVYTGDKIRSTMDHLGNGKPWDLNRRFNGLFIFPPSYEETGDRKEGEMSHLYSTINFLEQSKEEYILVCHENILAKVNLKKAFKHFVDTGADITLLYKNQDDPKGEFINSDALHLDDKGNLIKVGKHFGTKTAFNYYMGMAFIKKSLFINLIKEAMEAREGSSLREILLKSRKKYITNAFEFNGHMESIRNLKTYYEANMNILKRTVFKEIFFKEGLISTKAKDEPSALHTTTSKVENSIIANGCIIEGHVENSIIFRGVKIGKNAIVKNSIIMQKTEIEEDAIVVNTIADKHTRICKGVSLAGSQAIPYIIEKNQKVEKE